MYSNQNSLIRIAFTSKTKETVGYSRRVLIQKKTPILLKAAGQLQEYFAGTRHHFNIRLNPPGTPFQKKAWQTLSKIPYGKTISYKEQALKMKNKRAVRAVGSANGRNPIPIIIPCHRVIASNGSLAGYSGGLKIKSALLRIEHPSSSKKTQTF